MSNTSNEAGFTVARVEVRVFRAPVDTPVRTSFGVMSNRPAVLVRVEDVEGAFGWGEIWCNFPTCGAEHRARLIETTLAPLLIGHQFKDCESAWRTLVDRLRILKLQTREFGPIDQAAAGLDTALWDLAARRAGQPLWRFLGGRRSRVPVYASGINPELAGQRIATARQQGISAFKVKIGFEAESDLRVIDDVVDGLVDHERVMADANQAWDLETACAMAARLAERPLGWLEEPMPVDAPMQSWAQLAAGDTPPLAGGENFASKAAFMTAIESGYLSVIQPDVCKWGGVSECVLIGRAICGAGLRYCPHYLGGGIGLLTSAHLLAAVGGDGLLEVDCNPNPLRLALASPFPALVEGELELGDASGIGVEPAMDEVTRWQTLYLECHGDRD